MPKAMNNNAAMAPSPWGVVGLCMLFNVIDGLDAMAMAFTGGSVSAEWGLNATQLGMLLSASLVGMACGSFISPRADRYGRRPLLLAGLSLSGISMLLSFCSPNHQVLMLLRMLTGVGTGAVLVGANVLAHEYTGAHRRSLAIALQSLAFALGVSLGGLLAHLFNEWLGWRYVFLAGGVATLAVVTAGALWLRESPEFLALDRQARLRPSRGVEYRQLFAPGQWQLTASLALALLLLMFGYYFVMSWTPTLMLHNGFSEKQGSTGGLLLGLGGMLGALLVGLAANRAGGRQLLLGLLLLNAVVMTLLVPASRVSLLAIPVGFGAGLSLNGAIAALFILAPQAFFTAIRTSGVGLVLATGRLGAILSPAIAGVLLDAQWSTQELFGFFASSQLLAALLVWLGCRRPLSVPA
ncbi:putative MFS family arabinose efflux permease [Pseudomonas citronellolis]|uniref:MFS transporter n=1 Tax=Pseudomonas citronellolis TaxID=53408 RepID=UPI00387E928C|nr:putative MFS family arabinose efflux permease [Pseudomonas citronellolis]MCP1668404.1 putative MFS family arabinose efflux permease [Pseudomonas citronellolis]MCP1699990.1 putative MFS family arabinose efflux permease [Pseudomonas citronellolis]MCP1706381.1 putative MFS family arabinose efflux permease [Pseudomonas citronellolis]MCP1800171.1 putative MFS family arabinose efflux permease [Pseudomonas citronellolis]